MRGFITTRNLDEAEDAFPGIRRLYGGLRPKPRTFLDLMRLYLERTTFDHPAVAAVPVRVARR